MEEQFEFKKNQKIVLLALVAIGLLAVVVSIFVLNTGSSRVWSNVLLNNLYFLGIALGGGFFLAVHKLAWAGWHTVIVRLPEAMTSFLPVAAILMFLIYFGMNNIYHWTDTAHHDEILAGKASYLNKPFFFIRMLTYFIGWILMLMYLRKNSSALNHSDNLKYHKRSKIFAGLFIVFFAVTISASSWDWIMSIDAHWFSTLFGWYVLIGVFVTGIAFIILLIWFLKRAGLLQAVNKEHLHDLGKYLFAFSIFWTYLWFSQYVLIWYAHIPEETIYYIQRLEDFRILFFVNVGLNFVVPFFSLMTTNAKRNINLLAIVAAVVLIGHWINYYQMIMPGAVGEESGIGVIEIGMTVLYAGVFVFVVLRSLAKSPLSIKHDPFLKESLNYES